MRKVGVLFLGSLVVCACHESGTPTQVDGLRATAVVGETGAEMTTVDIRHTDFHPTGAPKVDMVNPAGVWIVRELPYRFDTLEDDLVGHQSGLFSFTVDRATGDGTGYGTFIFDVTWNELGGTFEGHFRGILTGGVFCGQFIGGGTADFEGMRINGRFCETGPDTDTYNSVARILGPGG